MKNNEPSDNQIDYARSLGIYIPFGITFDELSDLISNIENKDKLATDRVKSFADFYGVKYTKNVGKKTLFRNIQYVLFSQNQIEHMASWFIFRVYRTLVRGQENVSIPSPDNNIIQEVATTLLENPKFLNSLKRYADADLRYFGEFTDQNGITHYGASKTTNAYKLTSDELKKYSNVQQDIEKGWNAPARNKIDVQEQSVTSSSEPVTELFENFETKLKEMNAYKLTSDELKKYSNVQQDIEKGWSAPARNKIDIQEQSITSSSEPVTGFFENFETKLKEMSAKSEKKYKEKKAKSTNKSIGVAYLLLILFGLIGGHRFYLVRTISANTILIIFMLSLIFEPLRPLIVILVIWILIDFFLLPRMIKNPEKEWF